MAQIIEVLKSLDILSDSYSVFEKDQVLTHDHLNSIADYCDDQIRLTRVKLLGVGILCGLRLTSQGDKLTISKGVGVSTDGDLLFLGADKTYESFKKYDDSRPKYPPFYAQETMIDAYELLPKGEATPLAEFTNDEKDLRDMAALLFMESYDKDDDLCTATDCDNLGKHRCHTLRALLVDKANVRRLQASEDNPLEAALRLKPVAVARPLMAASIASEAALAERYREACKNINRQLTDRKSVV